MPVVPFRGVWVFALALINLLLLFKLLRHIRRLAKGGGGEMTPVEIGIIGFLLLFALLVLGMPIGFCLGLVGFLGMLTLFPFSAAMIKMATVPFQIMSSYTLAVLPLFLLMANIILVAGFGAGPLQSCGKVARAPAGRAGHGDDYSRFGFRCVHGLQSCDGRHHDPRRTARDEEARL